MHRGTEEVRPAVDHACMESFIFSLRKYAKATAADEDTETDEGRDDK